MVRCRSAPAGSGAAVLARLATPGKADGSSVPARQSSVGRLALDDQQGVLRRTSNGE